MCAVCVSASRELQGFLKTLQDKYPATVVDGVQVSPTHHVAVAVLTAAEIVKRAEIEYLQSISKVDFLDEKDVPGDSSLFEIRDGRA